MAACWSKGTFSQRLGFVAQVAPRVLAQWSGGHAGLKRRLLIWFAAQPAEWQNDVTAYTAMRLLPTLSQPILRELQSAQHKNGRVVLATAAPDLYARLLADRIGAVACIATTGQPGLGWSELLAERKAEACRKWLRENLGDRPFHVTVMTDHADDLPLLHIADHAVLQAPPRDLARLRAALSGVPELTWQRITEIDVQAEQDRGGMWLWFDDRPEGPFDHWEVSTILSKHRHARLYAGNGIWRPIGPGQSLSPAGLRADCPRPPSSRERLVIYLRRRVLRDWLGIFH